MVLPRKIPGPQNPTASVDATALAGEIERVARLDLAALRAQFRNRTGRIAPARISRPLLLRVLAYRIQAEAYGDLKFGTRRMLERLVSDARAGSSRLGGPGTPSPTAPPRPKPGTLLAREWQTRMERVMVLDEGYAWNGGTYASLSAVAFAITGTKWNGHRFFGLQHGARHPAGDRAPAKARPRPTEPLAEARS